MSIVAKARVLADFVTSGDLLRDLKTLAGARLHQPDASCPCCGFHGKFRTFGSPIRYGAMCPACLSMERHRLMKLAVDDGFVNFSGKRVLHFAPEKSVQGIIRSDEPAQYIRSSYPPSADADVSFDIENIPLPDASVDAVVCSHVLEHVDDMKALSSIHRVLVTGGQLVAMIPIIEGWDETYENITMVSEDDRRLHFGQFDHVRYYGADFRKRIAHAGFALSEYVANGATTIRHSLLRGERVFVATKL